MKTIRCLLIAGFIMIGFTILVFAAGNASTYNVTVQTIQLRNDAGQWITIATPNQEINIAGVGAGAVAGSMFNDASIPVGNYVNFKLVISETMTVAGSDGANFTTTNGSAILTGPAATAEAAELPGGVTGITESAETWNNAAAGEMTFQINLDSQDGDSIIEIYGKADLGDPIEVKAASQVSISFSFDTQGTIHFADAGSWGGGVPVTKVMYFTPPGDGTTLTVTIDGRSISIDANSMVMAF